MKNAGDGRGDDLKLRRTCTQGEELADFSP